MKPRRGRPPKLEPELVDKLCQALAAGNYRGPAAEWAGIAPSTMREWMRLGKDQRTGRYRDFRRRVLEAEKSAEIRAIGLVMKAAAEDPKHAEWWLERKFPMRWARREALKVDANLKADVTHAGVEALPVVADAERARRILDVMQRAGVLADFIESTKAKALEAETKEPS